MKIGFYKLGLNRPEINTLFGGMYGDFFLAISEEKNFEVVYISNIQDIHSVDVIVLPMGGNQDTESCQVMNRFKKPVILYTPPAQEWFNEKLLNRWSHKILFVYNTDESTYNRKKYLDAGIEYITLPFASSEQKFRPLNTEKIYDIVFVASAESGTGRFRYIDTLVEQARVKKWNLLLLGRKWERYGFPLQLVAHGELLNLIYNSAKICINISNDEQKLGENKRLDLNNRVFDLAMAGCFQISNGPEIIQKYFNNDEVIAVDPENIFVKYIEKYLEEDTKREEIAKKARVRALAEHTWRHRARMFTGKIETSIITFSSLRAKNDIYSKLLRKLDCIPQPEIIIKVWKKSKKILGIS